MNYKVDISKYSYFSKDLNDEKNRDCTVRSSCPIIASEGNHRL